MADMIHPPEPLNAGHDLSSFACGEPSLDQWLVRRAMTNQIAGASKGTEITHKPYSDSSKTHEKPSGIPGGFFLFHQSDSGLPALPGS